MGFYFIKEMKVHKYPIPSKCDQNYNGEKLYERFLKAAMLNVTNVLISKIFI